MTLGDTCLVVHPFALSLRVWLSNSFSNSKTSRRGSYLLHSYLHPAPCAAAADAVSVIAEVSQINSKQKEMFCVSACCAFPGSCMDAVVAAQQTAQWQGHVASHQEPLKTVMPLKYNHILSLQTSR